MSKDFLKAVGMRAIHTFFQVLSANLIGALAIEDVNWKYVISVSLMATIISVCKSMAIGVPEVEVKKNDTIRNNK